MNKCKILILKEKSRFSFDFSTLKLVIFSIKFYKYVSKYLNLFKDS